MAAKQATKWVARYEEGYVDADNTWTKVEGRLVADHGWASPQAAVQRWADRGDFQVAGVTRYGNGKQQVDDVRGRREFAVLGVTHVWRRITFVPTSPDRDPEPTPEHPPGQVASLAIGQQRKEVVSCNSMSSCR